MHIDMMTLDEVAVGKELKVHQINGGIGIRRKLNNMGIHTGDTIQIKRSGFMGGPILVKIHGMEVALGRGMARSIQVEQSG